MLQFWREHKYGIIGTGLFHLLLAIAFNIWMLAGKSTAEDDGLLINFQQMEIPEDPTILEKEIEEIKSESSKMNSNMAKDEFLKKYTGQENVSESFEKRASKEVDAKMKEIYDQTHKEVEQPEYSEHGDVEIDNKREETNSQKKPASEFSGTTNVTYAVENRKSVYLKIPVYMCEGSGKVVVEVEVSKIGKVTSARVNKQSKTLDEECLQKAAKEAAMLSSFNTDKNAATTQKGTITYQFVAQ